MKTKDILKQILMLPVAALLAMTTSSCGSETFDDAAMRAKSLFSDGSTDYKIPATVKVTRAESGDTRTVYNPSATGSRLSFETGDSLLISGTTADNIEFAGVLAYADGAFSGELSVSLPFSGTAEDLFKQATTNNTIDAYLLPKGYRTQGWMSITGQGAQRKISFDQSQRFCDNLAQAVAMLSTEHAKAYSSGFSLSPDYAIVDCTLKNAHARFVTCDEIGVTFNYKAGGTASKVTLEMEPTDHFCFGIEATPQGVSLSDISVTVTGGNEFETLNIDNKSIVCGKIYTLNKTIHMPATIMFPKTSVTLTYGYTPFVYPVLNTHDGTVVYSSSNTSVAVVDANTAKVSIVAPGTTVITAVVQNSDEYKYVVKEASYTLIIEKAPATISYATTAIEKKVGEAAFTNQLTNTGDGVVTYTSSDTNVATVDAKGKVTVKAEGSAVITATVADGVYNSYEVKTASYTVSVGKNAGSISYATTSISKKIDAGAFTNELKNTGTGTVTYDSSDTSVATVDGSGKVTIVGAGTTTITATVADDATYTYATKTASYTVTITKYDGTISYEIVEVNKVSTDAPFINPLTKTGDGYPIYSSSDENIAKVNAETGEVTIVGLGYVNITATVGETGLYVYNPDHVTYRLLVIDASDVGAQFGYGSNNFDTAPWK